jgi:protease PrsW
MCPTDEASVFRLFSLQSTQAISSGSSFACVLCFVDALCRTGVSQNQFASLQGTSKNCVFRAPAGHFQGKTHPLLILFQGKGWVSDVPNRIVYQPVKILFKKGDFIMIKEKRNLLNMGIVNILAMILIYVAAYFLFKNISLSSEMLGGSMIILLIGLVPAALWLTFFYFLDRVEPEPLELVCAAFFAGVIGQVAVNGFFGKILFDVTSWTGNAVAFPTVKTIFVEGIFPAVTIFFVIRYLFYPSKSFNEHVDGLMYGAFVGIGYSFMSTMADIYAVKEVSLYYLVFSLLVKFGVFSSLGALIGYSFGLARFKEKQKELYFLLAVIMAACVFSLYAFLNTRFMLNISTSSDTFTILLSVGFTVVLLAVVFILIQQTIKGHEAEKLDAHEFFIDVVSVLVIVLFLASGLFVRGIIERDASFVSENKKTSFVLPAAFQFNGEKDDVYTFSKTMSSEKNPIIIRVVLSKNILGSGSLKSRDETFRAGDYTVCEKEYDKTVILDEMNKKSFYAHVFEYTANKGGEGFVISIESPVSSFAGHKDLAVKIITSLRKGA